MGKIKVVVIGLGDRGCVHIYGLQGNNDEFDIVGICDIDNERLTAAAKEYNIDENKLFNDADTMLLETKPHVMVFATMPHLRIPFVEMAVKYKLKGLMFEKPMATTLKDAKYITQLCNDNNIKAVVCHQQKYLDSYIKMKQVIDSGEIGDIVRITAHTQAHASHQATHYIDYLLWANGGIKASSLVGHVHGAFYLKDGHPSPDYILGEIAFENGVRGSVECGYFTKQHSIHNTGFDYNIAESDFWTDARIMVYGTKGYVCGECNGRFTVFSSYTSPNVNSEKFPDFFEGQQFIAQVRYTKDFADWIRDDEKIHPSNVNLAYHGYQILEGIYKSAMDNTRIDFPFDDDVKYDMMERLENTLEPIAYRKLP